VERQEGYLSRKATNVRGVAKREGGRRSDRGNYAGHARKGFGGGWNGRR